jgi:hypothetical protein
MRISPPIAVLCMALSLFAGSSSAKVVRVDANSTGTIHDGISWTTAYATVAAAISAAHSGDEVWVARGTYTENVSPGAGVALYGGFAGTEALREQRDWKVNPTVLDGGGNTTKDIVTCKSVGTVVDGLTLRNGQFGVTVKGTASIANNTITGNLYGVDVTTGTAPAATITGNTITGNGFGVMVEWGTATLANNVIAGNDTGVWVQNSTAVLTNNTIAGNGGTGVIASPYSVVTLFNNLVASNGNHGIYRYSGTLSTFSHNDVYGNTPGDYYGYTPPTGQGNLSLDPLFVNRANMNFHVQTTSPCIDAGDDAAVTLGETDLDGMPRINGPHVDIGAYEYDSSAPPPFTAPDVKRALGIAGGLAVLSPDDVSRLNVEFGSAGVDRLDAVRIARKVAGLEANP